MRWAADLLATALPRTLRTRTSLTDTRIRNAAGEMAATIQGWLYTLNMGGADGLAKAQSALLEALPAAVHRDWESFPKTTVDQAATRKSRVHAITSVGRGIVVALIPLAGLVVLDGADVPVPDGAYLVAGLMPVTVLLRALDPRSEEQLGMVEQALGSVKGASDAIGISGRKP